MNINLDKVVEEILKFIALSTCLIGWLAGMAFAKGFWLTLASVCIPPYAWYLVVEKFIQAQSWL